MVQVTVVLCNFEMNTTTERCSRVTATQERTCRPILSKPYASMVQDGLQTAGPPEGASSAPPHTRIHTIEPVRHRQETLDLAA